MRERITGELMTTKLQTRVTRFLARNVVPALFAIAGVIYAIVGLVVLVLSASWFVNSPSRLALAFSDLLLLPFGVALMLVAAGLHARRRDVWLLAIGSIAVFSFITWSPFSAVAIEGGERQLDVLSLSVNALLIAVLVVSGRRYTVSGSLFRGRSYLTMAVAVGVLGGLYWVVASWLLDRPWVEIRAFQASESDLVVTSLTRLQLAACWALVILVLGFLFKVFGSLRGSHPRMAPQALRELLSRYGADSLDYFVTNEKKRHYLWRDGRGLIGYELVSGLALVSGDPICAPGDLDAIIEDFTFEMSRNGHEVAFWAISDDVAANLDKRGLTTLKLGEEATVDVTTFDVDALGSEGSDLKRAVRAVEARGIEFAFYRMEEVPGLIYSKMQELDRSWIAEFGAGSEERGFSMTLSRLPNFEDIDAAFAVAIDHSEPSNPTVIAYLSLVPVYNENSYSLDMMRRTKDAPNGINDFLLVHTLQIIRYHGRRYLSLNFAPLANTDAEPSLLARAASSLPASLKKSFYIDTLYAYNDKFDPRWAARHAAFNGSRSIIGVVRAVAKLEGSIEIDWRRQLAQVVAGSDHLVIKGSPAAIGHPSVDVDAPATAVTSDVAAQPTST